MAHYDVLMIGTEANLMQIYADCSDSSSETKAEMAFAYDYLCPISKNELLGKGIKNMILKIMNLPKKIQNYIIKLFKEECLMIALTSEIILPIIES